MLQSNPWRDAVRVISRIIAQLKGGQS